MDRRERLILFTLVLLLLGSMTALSAALVTVGGAPAEPGASPPAPTDRNNLTPAEQKLSSDLLDRVRESTPATGGEVVHVYVTLVPPAATAVVDAYAEEVTGRDEEHHLATARVRVDRLLDLAGREEVRSIMSVLPPVTREPTPEPTVAAPGWVPLLAIVLVPFLRRRG
jgi:hypothetical protein